MSAQPEVDPYQLADRRESVSGVLRCAELPRLASLSLDGGDEVAWRLEAHTNARGRAELHLSMSVRLHVRCQRCLEAMAVALELRSCLEVVRQEADLDALADEAPDVDGIVVPRRLDVAWLVEEEVFLALPPAPAHEPAGAAACRDVPAVAESPDPMQGRWLPFAGLGRGGGG